MLRVIESALKKEPHRSQTHSVDCSQSGIWLFLESMIIIIIITIMFVVSHILKIWSDKKLFINLTFIKLVKVLLTTRRIDDFWLA